MRWGVLTAIPATAIIGLWAGYSALTAPAVARPLVVLGGMMGLAGIAAVVMFCGLIWYVMVEHVRPAVRFRKPTYPIAIAQREASMLGETRFRHHPVKFWGALILGNRFLVGFMTFDKPEYLRFRDIETPAAQQEEASRHAG